MFNIHEGCFIRKLLEIIECKMMKMRIFFRLLNRDSDFYLRFETGLLYTMLPNFQNKSVHLKTYVWVDTEVITFT